MTSLDFPAAVSARICDHMNKDHNDALAYYLQYYAKIPAAPKNCSMVSISKAVMEIELQGKGEKEIVRIPIDPPLAEAKEARVRLIDMMYESLKGLGYSRYQVKEYKLDMLQVLTIIACLFMYWVFLTPTPLTPVEPFLRRHIVPLFQLFVMNLVPFAHMLETQLIMVPLLNKHRMHGSIRTKWVVASYVAGIPAIRTFKALVKQEQELVDSHRKDM